MVYPQTCPGNKIPASLTNAVGQKIAALFPSPNLAGDPMTHANNFYGTGEAETVNDHVDGRVDWAHNDKHSMYVRWSQRIRENEPTPDLFGNGSTPVLEYSDPGFNAVWGNTFTPSPTWAISVLSFQLQPLHDRRPAQCHLQRPGQRYCLVTAGRG